MENYDLIQESVSAVKELSPLVWEAAERQVQANIVLSSIWIVACIVMIWLLSIVLRRSVQEAKKPFLEQNDAYVPGLIFSGLGIVVLIIISMWSVTTLVNCLIAPEYQAIQLLIDLAK